jgi:hypothetical protein
MRRSSVRGLAGAALLVGVLVGGGCTTDDGATDTSTPTGSPSAAPAPHERELALGEAAPLTIRRSGDTSRVRLAVTKVTEGRIKDLRQFRLDARTRRSTPYYATARVTSLGGADLSGRSLTLWALGSDGTVRPPAEVIGLFRKCRSRPLPQRFATGDSARTCLLYLMPSGTTLQAVQYRFGDRPPYSWTVG